MKRWIHAETDDYSSFYQQIDQLIRDHYDNRNTNSVQDDVLNHLKFLIDYDMLDDIGVDVPVDWRQSAIDYMNSIGASTAINAKRDIEYKIKDYIAAWAKDDVKEGKPMADFREFKEEMKSEGLKADEDGYDYYVACYNNACEGSTKKVNSSYEISDGTDDYIDDFLEELAYETCDLDEEFDESEFEEFKKVAKDNGFIVNEGDFEVYLDHVKDIRG